MPTVYLPVELINRELLARAFLSVKLANSNHQVYVFEHTFFDRNDWHKKGIYIGKNCFRTEVPYSKFFYKKMKESGVNLWYLDEEGGVYPGDSSDWAEFLLCRLNPNDLDKEDKILVWGNWQKKVFDSCNSAAETVITGIPNFEILHPKYQKSMLEFDLEVTKGNKNYILINTRFGLGNSKRGIAEVFSSNSPTSKNYPDSFLENFFIADNQMMFDMIELSVTIAKSFPNEKIIIRPHPNEDENLYKQLTKKISNINVIKSGGVESWIRMSKVLIHNGCSTAIQANIAEKKVVTYLPKNGSKFQNKYAPGLPNSIGIIAGTHEEVISAIKETGYSPADNSWKETISELDSIDRILKLVEENCLIDKTDSSKSIKSRSYAKERIKDCFRKIIYKLAPSKKRDKFDYEHFSDLVNFVELANNHYQSNIKCKKITDGCYCIYK